MKQSTAARALALLVCLLMLCTGTACTQDTKNDPQNTATVQSVEMITGIGSTTVSDRYAGIVAAQKTVNIPYDSTKKIGTLYVKTGDSVTVGQKLFSYDLENLQYTYDKAKLELEQLQSTLEAAAGQKTTLEKEKAAAGADQQLSYTVQIQSLETDIREAQYNIKTKQSDLADMEARMQNTDVLSSVSGTVQSVNENGGAASDGTALPLIAIVDTGSYRIKGTISELNRSSLAAGTKVLVLSRTDSAVWKGEVSSIDWEKPLPAGDSGTNTDEMTSSSKYPFYVSLESTENLMLGQHVYIQPDTGTSNLTDTLLLPSYYITDADSAPYVWAENNGRLEKRSITLGAYNETADSYPVTAGLAVQDYIAFPTPELHAGMTTSHYDPTALPVNADSSSADGTVPENTAGEVG